MKVEIKQKKVKVVTKIIVDGKEYPLHAWNIGVANLYLATSDEKHLEDLKDFSLDI